MKTIGKLLIIALGVSLLGFIFKMTSIPGGGILLTLGLSFASVLTFIQLRFSLNQIKNNQALKITSASMSLTLSISFIGILFRYQWWPGWNLYYFLAIPLFVILTIVFFSIWNKFKESEYRKYITRNILLPWIFAFVFGIIPLVVSYKTFYNTFNYKSQSMTYEEFVDKIVQAPNN